VIPMLSSSMNGRSDLDFPNFLALLRRRAVMIVGIAVGAAVLAYGISSLFPDRYDASADVLFHQPAGTPPINPNEPSNESNAEPERVAATNLALAQLDIIAVRVKQRLDTEMSAKELREAVSVEPNGQADVATITARADTPEEAAEIANAFASEVVAIRRAKARGKIEGVIEAINAQLAELPNTPVSEHLASRAAQLEVEKRLESGDAEVVEQAVPPHSPSSPKPAQNAAIGFLLGLILGVVLALILRRFDRRLEDDEEIVEMVGAPAVGRIPVIKDEGWKRALAIESFQFLRANLQLGSATANCSTFAVTSALPEEGKSTIVRRFAEALAFSGASVIVVDCDLRRPTLHTSFGTPGDVGVTTALFSGESPERFLVDTGTQGIRLLPAGALTVMPGTLVTGDHDIGKLIRDLSQLAGYVVVDTAPATIGADASAIATEVDATLLVVDAEHVNRPILAAAVEQLHNAEATIGGVVLNRSQALLTDRAYQGYYGADAERAAYAQSVRSTRVGDAGR